MQTAKRFLIVFLIMLLAMGSSFAMDAHWAEDLVKDLPQAAGLFDEKDLDGAITAHDFDRLLMATLGGEETDLQNPVSREAAVDRVMKRWAEIFAMDLSSFPLVKMIPYADLEEVAADYRTSVLAAHQLGVARGVGGGLFSPKKGLTYGEAAALIHQAKGAIEEVRGHNEEKSLVVTLDVLRKTESVVFDIRLTNRSGDPATLTFPSSKRYDLVVLDESGQVVYDLAADQFYLMVITEETLEAGQTLQWTEEWTFGQEAPSPGIYRAEVKIDTQQKGLTAQAGFTLFSQNERGWIESSLAKSETEELALSVLGALTDEDDAALSTFVHPEKGLRLTPYTTVNPEQDQVFSKEEVASLFDDEKEYLWGAFDGTGDPIWMTPKEYLERFITTRDFAEADDVGYNEVLSQGNSIENQHEVYAHAIVVEFYDRGQNPAYEGMDWQSLRLVFQPFGGSWKLVGIIHGEWTI